MECDSTTVISIMQLLKKTAIIDAIKNFNNSDDWGEWDGHICCKITLFCYVIYYLLFTVVIPVKAKTLWNLVRFVCDWLNNNCPQMKQFTETTISFFKFWFLLIHFTLMLFFFAPKSNQTFSRFIERVSLNRSVGKNVAWKIMS